jgi:hypothetical protein
MKLTVTNIPANFRTETTGTQPFLLDRKYTILPYTNGKPQLQILAGYTIYAEVDIIKGIKQYVYKYTLPVYGALSFDEIRNNADVGSKIFYTPIWDGVELVGMLNMLTYSIAPTGGCINDTINYTKSAITYNGAGITYASELLTDFKNT